MTLEIANLSWGHPLPGGGWRQLFDDFNLSCQSGQFVVVIGNNGSGKSTLLNLIAGTLRLGAAASPWAGGPCIATATIAAPAGSAG